MKSERAVLICFLIFAIIYSTQCKSAGKGNSDAVTREMYRNRNLEEVLRSKTEFLVNRDLINRIWNQIKNNSGTCRQGENYNPRLQKCVSATTTNGFGNAGLGR